MKLSREKLFALVLLLAVLLVNAVALWHEISISRVDLNDNVYHFALTERIVQAVERGENPLDCWSPEWSMGYPVLRTYQPLAHVMVALVYFALGKSVGLMTVFVWLRFLSVALLPLSFFLAARLMGLRPSTSAAAALLAPLVSTNFLYGIEYGSYTWAGSGLFPQAIATHFLLIALGLAFGAIRRGRHMVIAGAMLGLTFLAHLIYGYMGAISVCVLAAIPDAGVSRWLRVRRAAMLGVVAFAISAFHLVPLLLDGATINHSRWEPVWKWDSFGAGQVLQWLFTGELLDHGRLPVLTLLAFLSVGLYIWNRRKKLPVNPAHTFALWGAAFWTLMFFGRPFWGPLLTMLGVSPDMQLHRVIGGAHVFLILLAAVALSALWDELGRRWQYPAAAFVTALLLFPMVQDRANNLGNDASWGKDNLTANAAERQSVEAALATVKARGGRAYAGLAAQWGANFKVGSVPFFAFLSTDNVPAVSFLYHSMALTSDIMVRFNEWNPSHYRLFNIRTVVAPAGASALPGFLLPLAQDGRFRIFTAPGDSYFDLVDVVASVKTTKNNFYDINDRWLQSDWVARGQYLRLDPRGDIKPELMHLAAEDALPPIPARPPPGEVRSDKRDGEVYGAELEAFRPCFALFKMTWHPNWKAWVDGRLQQTVMLSPGFIGVQLEPGRHSIVMRYEPGSTKAVLGFGGLLVVLLLIVMEARGWPARGWLRHAFAGWKDWQPSWAVTAGVRRRILTAGGLALARALPGLHSAIHRYGVVGARCLRIFSAPGGASSEPHPRRADAALGARSGQWHGPAAFSFPSSADLLPGRTLAYGGV